MKILTAALSLAIAVARNVTAPHAMVATAQHLATQAGIDVLLAGGNAVDAAIAVGYALAVVDPCCGNIGGGGFMLVRLHGGRERFIDFRERAPLRATRTMYLDARGNVRKDASTKGWLSIAVPGTVAAWNARAQSSARCRAAASWRPRSGSRATVFSILRPTCRHSATFRTPAIAGGSHSSPRRSR